MSRVELTTQIQKLIDTMPDEMLAEVLVYLKTHQDKSGKGQEWSQNLGKIISEDANLLKRLAQ